MEKDRGVDGLRGIAALNVALSHFIAAFLPTWLHFDYPWVFPEATDAPWWYPVVTSPATTLFYNGHFAVLVFFAISGYVLARPFYAKDDVETLRRRLWGRYVRLNVPIAAAIGIAWALYAAGACFNLEAGKLSGSSWLQQYFPPGLALGQAIRESAFGSIVFGATTFDPPLWSLKIEFIGSIYLLAFHLALPRSGRLWAWLTLAAFLPLMHGAESIYYATIFAGALVNRIRLDAAATTIAFVLGCYFGAFHHGSVAYAVLSLADWGQTIATQKMMWHAVGGVLLTVAVANGFARPFFESPPLRFLGRVSFSLYLLHFLVLCSAASAVYVLLSVEGRQLVFLLLAYLAACLGVAAIFERYVDRVAIGLSKRLTATPDGSLARLDKLLRRLALR